MIFPYVAVNEIDKATVCPAEAGTEPRLKFVSPVAAALRARGCRAVDQHRQAGRHRGIRANLHRACLLVSEPGEPGIEAVASHRSATYHYWVVVWRCHCGRYDNFPNTATT
jgi:hypothetical protein